MPIRAHSGTTPNWEGLHALAQGQAGYFTTRDAADHHIGTALLTHHAKTRRIVHAGRGVFRFAQYPSTEREELVPVWLWSDRVGVFSHETALSLHALSDLAPTHVDLTVPAAWQARRLRIPPRVELHYADLSAGDRTSWGPVPCTTIVRTLNDAVEIEIEEQFVRQAVTEAWRRGVLTADDRLLLRPEVRRLLPRQMARSKP